MVARNATKEEKRRYQRDWTRRNSVKRQEHNRRNKQKIQRWYRELKNILSCIVCDEDENVCLDFHHLDPSGKDFNIPDLVNQGYGIEKIKTEVDKCVILCANCHRKVHAGLIDLDREAKASKAQQ
jgi:transcription elongation factor Elf1